MASGASQAARWQAYQTRARMGAQLWFEVMILTLASWAALTMYVVWQRTGEFFPQLNHAYFWRWVICGILTWLPAARRHGAALFAAGRRRRLVLARPADRLAEQRQRCTISPSRCGSGTTASAPRWSRWGSRSWSSCGAHVGWWTRNICAACDC